MDSIRTVSMEYGDTRVSIYLIDLAEDHKQTAQNCQTARPGKEINRPNIYARLRDSRNRWSGRWFLRRI